MITGTSAGKKGFSCREVDGSYVHVAVMRNSSYLHNSKSLVQFVKGLKNQLMPSGGNKSI
jgi:hypothetical protein